MEFDGYWKNTASTKPSPFRYNGKEWQSDIGWNDYGARHYDPVVGGWWRVDPLASDMPEWSPYNYTFNNPIKYTDPDGRNPILGFLIGAATELAIQKLTGQEINFTKALVSGAAGALSAGLSTIKNIGTVTKLIIGATIDGTESVTKQTLDGKGVSMAQTFSDVVMSGVAGQAKVADNANTKLLEKTADRTKRIAAGDPASTGRAANAANAKSAFISAKNSPKNKNLVTGSVAADAAQTASDLLRATPEKKPEIFKKPIEMVQDNTRVIKMQ